MQIQHQAVGRKGAFFVEENGEWLAELSYSKPSEDKMIIDYTEVSEDLRGQDVGTQLVEAAVEFARSEKLQIIPECSFTKSVLEKHPEFNDVVV